MLYRRSRTVFAPSSSERKNMRAAGKVVASTLALVQKMIRPGISTAELDIAARDHIRSMSAQPSFLGYQGFPATLCVSINDEVVHGIPSTEVFLEEGDLVSVDCGAIVHGWHADSATTIPVGTVTRNENQLMLITQRVLAAGIEKMMPGNRVTDISAAMERALDQFSVESGAKFGMIEGFGGHGIGKKLHLDPFVPNYGAPGRGMLIAEGSVLAIEPMVSLGSVCTREKPDQWTVVTTDGARTAHFEHTVCATSEGPILLTSP